MKRFSVFLLIILFCANVQRIFAQQGTTINLKADKPQEDKNKPLRAEKTDYGKLPPLKKFLQNTYAHYNYLFNANQIYNQIFQDAIASNIDDYSQLLSFYPYNENILASNHQFDSVIQHATSGLLLHDLRNDYVDELYFILGKSYFFEKKYDTASQTFRYINYAFAPKDEGYDIPIGSNISSDKNKQFTISSKEANGLKKNNLKNINRRNDALLWLARNFIEQKDYTQAGILLNNLGRDAQFPDRLKALFFETKAYFFYKQRMYDSAATYLAQCSFSDDTKYLRSRRAYLSAQLFQLSNEDSSAIEQYKLAQEYSNDPLIEIYVQKNIIQLQNNMDNKKLVENSLNGLLRKNKFYQYKDLIYYNQAEIARSNNNDSNAENLLRQSIKANRNSITPNQEQKSKTFLMLGDVEYDHYRFDSASKHYDSVSANYIKDTIAKQRLQTRLSPLNDMKANYDSIHIQDSLLALANMPEKDRMAILKQRAKQIRRTIDKREESDNNVPINGFVKQNQQPVDLFSQGGSPTTWYFNNPTLKSAGYQSFKQKFGNRPNVDNWQRLSAISQNISAPQENAQSSSISGFNSDGTMQLDSSDIRAEDLLADLPMTPEKKDSATKKITKNMLDNGNILMNKLENFPGAIALYDSLLNKYPKAKEVPEALYNQYVCYILMNKLQDANITKNKLLSTYPNDKWSAKIKNEADSSHKVSPTSIANAATKEYSDIYDLFLSGHFDEALNRKNIADKTYGHFYWTPQLLYIEAIYFVTKHNDSMAIADLRGIINSFHTSPMVPQARDLIDVLLHRREIEDYLTKLNIKPEDYTDENMLAMLEQGARRMNEEKRIYMNKDSLAKFAKPVVTKEDQPLNANPKDIIDHSNDDTAQVAANNPKANNESIDTIVKTRPAQNIIDTINETKNTVINQPKIDTISDNNIAINNKPVQINNPSDTLQAVKPKQHADSANNSANNSPQKNNVAKNNQPKNNNIPQNNVKPESHATRTINGFMFDDNAPLYVTVVLDNVDPVFASEASNAFNRYNLSTFPNQSYNVNSQKVEDDNIVLIGPFKNLQEAKDYQAKIQPQTAEQIIPWITDASKYSFLKISPQNLGKIHTKADIQKYRSAAIQAGSE